MRARKSLGQHFLMHAQIAQRIVNAADIEKDTAVLEIGPGTGILTRALLEKARVVYAVEADARLVEELKEKFSKEIKSKQLKLVHADIRAFDLTTLPHSYVLVANIPYYLTGDILRTFLESPHQPRSMTLLVQKEVAVRIAREKKESILSLSVKAYGQPHYRFTVPRGAFRPAPGVDSAVLSISHISREHFRTKQEEGRFFEVLRAGFAHKRKFLASNLKGMSVDTSRIPAKTRAEDLSLSAWLALIAQTG